MNVKRNLFSLALAAMAISMNAQQAIPRDENIEKKVEKTLRKMTLEEKIGQMCELAIDVITDRTAPANDFRIDKARLDTVIRIYKVGSILNVPAGHAQNKEKWQEIIKTIQDKSLKELGIPCIYGVDQMHGTTYTAGGTLFPQGNNMAATFNRALVREGSRISAYETKAGSIPWVYAPVVDLGREPRWSRMWENFGEDAYLNAEMGRESVLGFQGNDPNHIGKYNVAACMKHFMGYGVPTTGKDRTPSNISPLEMREKHFAPFLEAIRNGALTVMVNSQSNNGMPLHANYEYLTQWLKNETGWDGMVVTDWADIVNLFSRDHIAKDKKDAIRIAINAGIDMSMDPYSWDFCTLLKELVNEGKVPMSRIDDATRRVLRLKYRIGLFDTPYYNYKDFPKFGSKEFADKALDAAEQSIVLLKNQDNILPLAKGRKILVTGPNGNTMRGLNGGWTMTWQGFNADDYYPQMNTIFEAMQNKYGKENVTYVPGVTYKQDQPWADAYWMENTPEIDKAVAAAQNADVIIACVGENSYAETPGNLDDLALSENQQNLVKALAKTGKPIILVLNEGRPRLIKDIEPLAKAVVDAMLPSNYGGDALANLLSGDVNFSGKLPFTYPKNQAALTKYDFKPCEQVETMSGAYNYNAVVSVQWAFGYGLSYTTYKYSNLRADKSHFTADDNITFTVDVTNTGKVAGKESVLLFASDLVASLTPDNRRLRAFDKIDLQPGETKTVSLTVPAKDLAFVGYDGKWILEEGDFRIQTGDQTLTVSCDQTKKWETPNR
ncbi:MAG: glycoside hydrolase family 3 C-terminal domain-containing protein [Prevotella sp.]|nr:glycoside hydrolase family 3 C-terminal domain-containing protein [Prevotella sp.]